MEIIFNSIKTFPFSLDIIATVDGEKWECEFHPTIHGNFNISNIVDYEEGCWKAPEKISDAILRKVNRDLLYLWGEVYGIK